MKIETTSQALESLAQIRAHQKKAGESISPLTKAAEAEKAVNAAINIIEFLITSGDAKETPCQETPSGQ